MNMTFNYLVIGDVRVFQSTQANGSLLGPCWKVCVSSHTTTFKSVQDFKSTDGSIFKPIELPDPTSYWNEDKKLAEVDQGIK